MILACFIVLATTAIFCCLTVAQVTENPCGSNEALFPCGRTCEKKCNAELPNFCRTSSCLGFGCRYRNRFERHPVTNRCVTTQNCPAREARLCGTGEVLGPCGRTCEGTCRRPFQPEECQRMLCQGLACRCDLQDGFVRNERTRRCVRMGSCPDAK